MGKQGIQVKALCGGLADRHRKQQITSRAFGVKTGRGESEGPCGAGEYGWQLLGFESEPAPTASSFTSTYRVVLFLEAVGPLGGGAELAEAGH